MAEIALIMNELGPGLSASLLCQLNRLVQLMLLLECQMLDRGFKVVTPESVCHWSQNCEPCHEPFA